MHTMLGACETTSVREPDYATKRGCEHAKVREEYFRELLYGQPRPADSGFAVPAEDGGRYTVVFVEIDDEARRGGCVSARQEHALLREARARLAEQLTAHQIRYMASHGCFSIVIILSSAEESGGRLKPAFESFQATLSAGFAGATFGISASSPRPDEIRHLFRQAELSVKYGKRGSVNAADDRTAAAVSVGGEEPEQPGRHRRLVADIRSYIAQNAASIANVDQVAGIFYLSSRYANQLFKHYTGQTIFDFVIESRLEAAKRLLAAPQAKVYEVSEQIGYQNHSYFSSLFKQNTGLTPKQYMDRYGRTS